MIGMRLNQSQGMRPRHVSGIAVSVKRCECGLIFADPQPVPDDLADHYGVPPEEYWSDLGWDSDYFSEQIATAKRLLPFETGMTALDIGAGQGKAMRSLLEAGFDARGIEPSEPFFERLGFLGDRVTMTKLEEADFPEQSFDFITFGAVLEHLFSPRDALARTMKWLKPGGIVQAEVPSSDYLVSRIVNRFFRLRGTNYVTHISPMHAPFHLFEFTLESFRRNGKILGYEVAEHQFDVGGIPHLPSFTHPLLKWWMEKRQSGMQLTVYLRRTA